MMKSGVFRRGGNEMMRRRVRIRPLGLASAFVAVIGLAAATATAPIAAIGGADGVGNPLEAIVEHDRPRQTSESGVGGVARPENGVFLDGGDLQLIGRRLEVANETVMNVTFNYEVEANLTEKSIEEILDDLRNETLDVLDEFFDRSDEEAEVKVHELYSNEIEPSCAPSASWDTCLHLESTITLSHDNNTDSGELEQNILVYIPIFIEKFNEDNVGLVNVTYIGPLHVSTLIEIEISGVPSRDMTEEQIEMFERVVLEFLRKRLLEEYNIIVTDVDVLFQNVEATSRRRRWLEGSTNVVTVQVTGSYSPPPYQDLDQVASDAINADAEKDRQLETDLKEQNDDYFRDVIVNGASTPITEPPPTRTVPPLIEPEEKGTPAWVLITFGISCVVLVGGAVYILRKKYKGSDKVSTAEVHYADDDKSEDDEEDDNFADDDRTESHGDDNGDDDDDAHPDFGQDQTEDII